jgi:hypothetical protein
MIGRILIILKTFAICLALLLISCKSKPVKNGMLILSETPGNIKPDLLSGPAGRYFPGARISVIRPGKPDSHIILTEDFYSACFPDISYDGRFMLFTAQQNEGDPWQIWEMELRKLKSRKITSFAENCTDPVYLPGGRMAFSRLTVNDTVKSAHCLYTCNLDGSGLRQISFSPGSNFATTVLKDGRLLTISRQMEPDRGNPMFMVLRPDGTKADLFYMGEAGTAITGNACETSDGKIVFIESDKETLSNKNIISIKYNRPLHSRVNLTSGINCDFQYALPIKSDKYLVSCRNSDSELFALFEFDPEKKTLGKMVSSDPVYNIIEVAVAEEYERPKKLPSEVDMHVKTGLLLCQDINVLRFQPGTGKSAVPGASMIEVLGVDSTYGVVAVEKDGSFQLKILADKPFRIQTLDGNGHVLHGPSSWLWLRPNERRGCVGCHEDPELVPENRIPLAVKKAPVIIPVNIIQIKEKIVELE